MLAQVQDTGTGATPLRIGIWDPRSSIGYYITFGPPPFDQIAIQLVEAGKVLSETIVGDHNPGQQYRLIFERDRDAQVIRASVSSIGDTPVRGNIMRLQGGPGDPAYADILSDTFPITGGQEYVFGGMVRAQAGTDAYKAVLQWLDKDGKLLGFVNDWRSVGSLVGWTTLETRATAPPRAVRARMQLGSGKATIVLFNGLYVRQASQPDVNLLPNGDLEAGIHGWSVPANRRSPFIFKLTPIDILTTVTPKEVPSLFNVTRLSLTAEGFTSGDGSKALVSEYSVTLPSKMWSSVKIDDPRAQAATKSLLWAGAFLCAIAIALAGVATFRRAVSSTRGRSALGCLFDRPVAFPSWPLLLVFLCGAVLFLIGNALLFRIGSHPFDITSFKIYSYIASQYSMTDLYSRAGLVSLAKVWNGAPFHEAIFAYLPVLAYHHLLIGWADKLLLNEPGVFRMDAQSMEFLIKLGNVIFALADAILICLILRYLGLGRRSIFVVVALFLFSPAVLITMSLIGSSETVSLFFILLSVLMSIRGNSVGAWTSIALAALTRPQMAVLALVLGLVYLRRFSVLQNIRGTSWAVIISFLILGPFILELSPSLPVDYFKRLYLTKVEGSADPSATVSIGAYSIWPFITHYLDGLTGRMRFFQVITAPAIGGLTYGQLANALVGIVLLGVTALVLGVRRVSHDPRIYISVLALALLAWMMVMPGMAARYFVYPLVLLLLCQVSLRGPIFYLLVGVLSLTTGISVYGSLGYAVNDVPHLAPLFHASSNPITRVIMSLYFNDQFITIATYLNMIIVLFLGIITVGPLFSSLLRGGKDQITRDMAWRLSNKMRIPKALIGAVVFIVLVGLSSALAIGVWLPKSNNVSLEPASADVGLPTETPTPAPTAAAALTGTPDVGTTLTPSSTPIRTLEPTATPTLAVTPTYTPTPTPAPTPTPTPPSLPHRNLLANSSFELEESGWRGFSELNMLVPSGRLGWALRMERGVEDSETNISSDVMAIMPGEKYLIGGWARSTGGGSGTYKIVAEWRSGAGRVIGYTADWSVWQRISTDQWVFVWTITEPPPEAMQVRLRIGIAAGNVLTFDDLIFGPLS
jgi:hypothetical protein